LVIGSLTIASSRADELERPASGTPDTVQFWITPSRRWKVRTFAVDHEVLAWDLGDLGSARDRPTEFALQHITTNYADVLASSQVVEISDPRDITVATRALAEHGLDGVLQRCEAADAEIWLWSPDGATYATTNPD
jgi:hypothetical protein